jgi:serine/threonine protein kinase/3',5'-cyclic AMP phosphodiesterase CpdA
LGIPPETGGKKPRGRRPQKEVGSAREQRPILRLPLTVLHLTDLHFAERSERFPSAHYWNTPEWPALEEPQYNRRGLLESILRDLKENQWTPELVIISGDLLDRGQESGVALAIDFLKRLSELLSLGRERFVLVPGNHDEVRDAHTVEERYSRFSRIWTGFYGGSRPWVFGRPAHEQVELFDLRSSLGVQIVGFNSCEGHDRGLFSGGAVGVNQQERAEELLGRSGEAPFRIAVMHHHLYNPTGVRKDMTVMEGASELRGWLKKHRFQLAVHGHQHVDWHEEDSAGDWTLSVVAGASAGVGQYGRQRWDLRLGYQVIRIEEEGRGWRLRRWYDPMSRSFTAASPREREELRFGAWQVQDQEREVTDPGPHYPDDEARLLSIQLADARERKRHLQKEGVSTAQVDREILDLRRQLREGGRLRAGGELGGERFLLLEPVGQGGFATVWKARDRKSQEIVAIKVLHPNLVGDTEKLERFFRGARRMAELRHPAVARVLEQYGEDGGYFYFVMEYVEGGNLRQAVLRKTVTPEKAIAIILRIGDALALAHSRGVIHRDIKPANILLDEQGQPLLTDFDLVGALDTTGGTRTGAMGTAAYAAPECLERPQDADPRSDVYSLGMTAIFGIYGADLPFPKIFGNRESFFRQLSCPEPLKDVLSRATSLEPGDRYPDAGEFIKQVRHASRQASRPPPSPPRRTTSRPSIVEDEDVTRPPSREADAHKGAGALNASVQGDEITDSDTKPTWGQSPKPATDFTPGFGREPLPPRRRTTGQVNQLKAAARAEGPRSLAEEMSEYMPPQGGGAAVARRRTDESPRRGTSAGLIQSAPEPAPGSRNRTSSRVDTKAASRLSNSKPEENDTSPPLRQSSPPSPRSVSRWELLIKIFLGLSAVMAALQIVVLRQPIMDLLTGARSQEIFVTVDTTPKVMVKVRHNNKNCSPEPFTELGMTPIKNARGVHLQDTLILENKEQGIYAEENIPYGEPGELKNFRREFKMGQVRLRLRPVAFGEIRIVRNGQELGVYQPGVKLDLVEGQHKLELRGDILKEPVPVEVQVKRGDLIEAQVDISGYLRP